MSNLEEIIGRPLPLLRANYVLCTTSDGVHLLKRTVFAWAFNPGEIRSVCGIPLKICEYLPRPKVIQSRSKFYSFGPEDRWAVWAGLADEVESTDPPFVLVNEAAMRGLQGVWSTQRLIRHATA